MKKIAILSVIMLISMLGCDSGQSSQREVKKEMAGSKTTGVGGYVCRGLFLVRGVRF